MNNNNNNKDRNLKKLIQNFKVYQEDGGNSLRIFYVRGISNFIFFISKILRPLSVPTHLLLFNFFYVSKQASSYQKEKKKIERSKQSNLTKLQ